MDNSLIAPELRSAARWMPTMTSDNRFSRWAGRKLTRLMPSAKIDGVTVENRRDTPRLRLYRPSEQRSRSAVLWFHGGGFMMGSPAMDDRHCALTAQKLGIIVASVEYRFAPEHPFPAAMDDGYVAWEWLQGAAHTLGIDKDRIVVGGQSAGGGLAAGLVQRIHDGGGKGALAQWLFCPMLDDRTVGRHELDAVEHRIWSNLSNRIGWRAYLGREPDGIAPPPYAAPARREDLSGLPPTWIGVGDIDLFFDEDRVYAERLRAAGIETCLVTVPGAPHGFEAWAHKTELARSYIANAHTWLAQQIGTASALDVGARR